jgi:hypothetical protein
MSSINIIMAIAVWRVTSLPETAQRIVLRIAIVFAVAAAILLITTIASWFVKKMPDLFGPSNNVLRPKSSARRLMEEYFQKT